MSRMAGSKNKMLNKNAKFSIKLFRAGECSKTKRQDRTMPQKASNCTKLTTARKTKDQIKLFQINGQMERQEEHKDGVTYFPSIIIDEYVIMRLLRGNLFLPFFGKNGGESEKGNAGCQLIRSAYRTRMRLLTSCASYCSFPWDHYWKNTEVTQKKCLYNFTGCPKSLVLIFLPFFSQISFSQITFLCNHWDFSIYWCWRFERSD